MILSESLTSSIDDTSVLPILTRVIYTGGEYRDVWVGAYRPETTSDDPELIRLRNGNLVNYLYYLSFVEDFMEPDGEVLDIGCGSGARTAMLARYASRVVGIESVPEVLSFASTQNPAPNAEYILGSFPDAFLGGPFDYAFMVEVIEHVPHYKQIAFIESALSELKTGGLLFITTPANEDTCGEPHVGIWTRKQLGVVLSAFCRRIVHMGHLDNKTTFDTGNPRSNRMGATHHRLVIQA